ncbi:PAS domain S-box protein [Alteromonadaceae bacterium M269]|nr:PAS domain S-box protein [Alteromonadaceae bacterium M269]
MGFKKFSLMIAARTVLIMVNLVALTLLVTTPGYHTTTIVASAVLVFQCVWLIRFVEKTNSELVRFLDAARYADYSQRFELSSFGSGFEELSNTFTDILKRFQRVRSEQEEQQRHLKAIVEHVPVPLMSIDTDGALTLWNNASRKLFGTNPVTQWQDLMSFGEAFAKQVSTIKPGQRHLATFTVDGMEHQLSLSATQIRLTDKHEMLISMQDIQSELDSAQLQAWQDLVKVLTHEIMNSITPVASLAKTASDLVEDSKTKVGEHPQVIEELDDIADAVKTVARRSDGLIHFVNSYRKLTRLPSPNKKVIRVEELLKQSTMLATQDWQAKGIQLNVSVIPNELDISADANMIEQLLINLLQNAEHAVAGNHDAQVELKAYLNPRGHVVVQVSDNGGGIASDVSTKIFVPFFTTKTNGSGVGLALARQIMLAHNGTIKYSDSASGGACFSLRF